MSSFNEIIPIKFNSAGISCLTFSWQGGCETFPYHFHERIEIIYIESGELILSIDEKEYIATENQAIVFSPFSKHKGFSGKNGVKYHVITFNLTDFINSSIASKKYLSSTTKNNIAFSPINDNPEIIKAIKELISYLEYETNVNPLCYMGKMYEIIGLLYQISAVRKNGYYPQKEEDDFNEVIEYIDKNFLSDISTKDISEKFGYNTAYFCRKFKIETGTTAMNYIRALRLEYGKRLLLESDDSINNIAWKSGFSDKSHFSNFFKKLYKLSPTNYRKVHKGLSFKSQKK